MLLSNNQALTSHVTSAMIVNQAKMFLEQMFAPPARRFMDPS